MHLLVVHDANLLAPKHQHLKMEQPRRHSKTTTDLPQKTTKGGMLYVFSLP